MKTLIQIFTITLVSLSFIGCAGFGKKLKSFVSGEPSKKEQSQNKQAKFSDKKNVPLSGAPKQYTRMTREKFEEDAKLSERAGSLWVMEGQNSYLFSQNMMRSVGDIINVQLDGQPQQQLSTKVTVLKKLMERAMKAKNRAVAAAQAQQAAQAAAKKSDKPKDAEKDKDKAKTEDKKDNPQQAGNKEEGKKDDENDEAEGDFNVGLVPTRIVETLEDGSFRVKGSSSFMIGRREYKVIVTGLVRSRDVADDGVKASRMLDSKFDIVSLRKELSL